MRLILLLLATSLAATAQSASVASLLAKDIHEFQGKEAIVLTVTYAHVFVYVLEGSVVMKVAGREHKQLGPGETFYEQPSDVHTVSKNASATKPAKILVMMLKDKGQPVTEPAASK